MNTTPRRRAATIAASVGIVALLAAGCTRGANTGGTSGDGASGAAKASPGITDTTVTFGITTPLSGTTAGPGTCTVAGLKAYAGAKNAAGGFAFGDGKTRKMEITALDDAYDPQKAAANFAQLKDKVFAMTAGLGTPTNRAWREAAAAAQVPQALIMTGDPIFSDKTQSPWALGFVPVYANEGEAFGKLLAGSATDHKVVILAQNDDFGKGYAEGFKKAVASNPKIQIVKELTYEASDTSVDAQITEMSATGADVVFNAMSITPLVVTAMQKAQQLNWKPSWFQPSNTSSPGAILKPAGAQVFPGVYTVSFAKAPASPAFAKDPDVVKFLEDLKTYGDYKDMPAFPHCMWSYQIGATLEQVFAKMKEPTRQNFMDELRNVSGFAAPLMLPGTSVDTTKEGQPAVSTVQVVKYNGTGFSEAKSYDN